MSWNIRQICTEEEAVYVQRNGSSVIQKFSVPGVETALIKEGELIIRAKTGFLWFVDLATGSRRRILDASPKPDY